MKRVLTVVTCVLAFGAAASVASASTSALPSCTHCGYVSAHGNGTITENAADGLSYGTVTSGSIAIRGGKHTVGGWSKKKWDPKLNANVYTGKSMCYRVSGKFWVRVAGTVKNFGSTARASVTFYGSGVYTLGNGKQHSWSRAPSHTLSIRW